MTWLWASLIVVGAAIACGLLYIYEKRKSIFKKRSKEEKAAKKQQKKLKKQAKLAKKENKPIEPIKKEEPKEEISLSEKIVKKEETFTLQTSEYVPSNEFKPKEVKPQQFNSFMPQRGPSRLTEQQRRMLIERNKRMKEDADFEQFRRKHGYSQALKQSVKDQIINLSPEMKALLFTGALEKRDDDQF